MASGKSPGSDGITIVMIKSSTRNRVPFLVELFNTILHSGNYTQQWREAIICSLHKKGSIYDPQNYRGISVLCVLVKKTSIKSLCKNLTKNFLVRFLQRLLILVCKHGLITMIYTKINKQVIGKVFQQFIIFFILYAVFSKYVFEKKGRMYVCMYCW